MSIVHRIHTDLALVVTSCRGVLDDRILYEAYEHLYRKSDWKPGFAELVDLRKANMNGVTGDGLRRLARLAESSVGSEVDSFRTALLVEDELPFGLARMYGTFADPLAEDVQVFRELDEALEWLAVPEEIRPVLRAELAEGAGPGGEGPGA